MEIYTTKNKNIININNVQYEIISLVSTIEFKNVEFKQVPTKPPFPLI